MNILFTRFPYESAEGGAENQTMWLMNGLRRKGHQISFLGDCPVLLRKSAELKIENGKLEIGKPPVTKWLALSFFWRHKKMQQKLIEAMERGPKPDAIVMLSMSEKLLLTEWAVQRGIRVLWIEHDRVGRWLTWSPWLSELKRFARMATVVCVSALSREKYIEMGFENVVAVPNGVPSLRSGPHPSSTSRSAGHPLHSDGEGKMLHVGCIARLSKEKGVDVLVRAIADMPEVTLTIVGRGPDEGYIRTLIAEDTKRVGMQRIFLESTIENLDEFYASVDALALPSSDHDPFGLVAAEAMVRGRAVIVTDACGIAGYLSNGTDALIAKAGSNESLAEAIKKLEDAELRLRLAEAGEKKARQQFSLDTMVERYQQVLNKS